MSNNSHTRRFKFTVSVFCLVLLTACTSSTENESKTSIKENFEWNLDSTFRTSLDEDLTSKWGFKQSDDMSLEIEVADFEDPNRTTIKDEVDSTIPSECIGVAQFVMTSKKSEAKYLMKQTFEKFLDTSLQIYVYTYGSDTKASERFSSFLSKAPVCGYFIPVDINGKKFIALDLWKKIDYQSADEFIVYNALYNEATIVGIAGSAVYSIYVSNDKNFNLAKNIVSEIKVDVKDQLLTIQAGS
jgi:hypothetical protein